MKTTETKSKPDSTTDTEIMSDTTAPKVGSSALFCVGLPDTRGRMCWLAGYESDPTRYYSARCALTFDTRQAAEDAIERAKKTHPFKERTYRIMTVAEMETQNETSGAPAEMETQNETSGAPADDAIRVTLIEK